MILVSGEALIDLFIGHRNDNRLSRRGRGWRLPFNVAIGLGRLGRPAAFLSTLSEDVFGSFLAEKLAESGVSSSYIQRLPNVTTLSVVATSPDGQPQYSFYAPEQRRPRPHPGGVARRLPADVNAIAAAPMRSVSSLSRPPSRPCCAGRPDRA